MHTLACSMSNIRILFSRSLGPLRGPTSRLIQGYAFIIDVLRLTNSSEDLQNQSKICGKSLSRAQGKVNHIKKTTGALKKPFANIYKGLNVQMQQLTALNYTAQTVPQCKIVLLAQWPVFKIKLSNNKNMCGIFFISKAGHCIAQSYKKECVIT